MSANRQLDVIVWGATGFTGKLTCKYIHENYPSLRWALAGRQREKLLQVKRDLAINDKIDILTADVADSKSLDDLFKQTSVVLSTAGPYEKIGSEVVRSCVRTGTNYCDLTAETQWIRKMIDELGEEAKSKKIKIINSSAFDCVPSDLGCQMIVDEMKKRNIQPVEVRMLVEGINGGASGGTLASGIGILESPFSTIVQLMNPFYLNNRLPNGDIDQPTDKSVVYAASDAYFPSYDSIANHWTMPYVMQGANTRIVNRSNSLLNFQYGKNFIYSERVKRNIVVCLLGTLVMNIAGALLLFSWTRNMIKMILPKPGTGPNEKVRDSGYFIMSFWGKGVNKATNEVTVVRGGITAMNGDPGYKQTAVMIAESAICLALDKDKLPKEYGFVTPAVGMGKTLRDRLCQQGIKFHVSNE